MVDKKELEEAIKNSGKKRNYLAEKLNISSTSLYNKLNGITEFTAREMFVLSDELDLSEQDSKKIFYL